MTDLKYSILEMVYQSQYRTVAVADLLNAQLDMPANVQRAYRDLVKIDKYLVQPVGTHSLKLTDKGIADFELEQERRQQYAKQCADKAAEERTKVAQAEKDKKQQLRHNLIVSIVSTVLGALITLVIEHFQELVNFILSLFG